MLGYVRKSKITTANTTAKSIYNAFNTALVDLDTIDASGVSLADGTFNGSQFNDNSGTAALNRSVYGYFSDVAKVSSFYIDAEQGACVGCGVLNGKYPGAYPIQWTVQGYKNANQSISSPQDSYDKSNGSSKVSMT